MADEMRLWTVTRTWRFVRARTAVEAIELTQGVFHDEVVSDEVRVRASDVSE